MSDIFDKEYDVVIIGGGAIGSSIALDSSSRMHKTLIVEQNDFASGTSSKSTKLLHGGVRYLEKAVNDLNIKQYTLVNEALEERFHFLNKANHISNKIKLLTPILKWYELLYYYIGLKMYDFISKTRSIGSTTIKNKNELKTLIPHINKKHNSWAVEYYDGSFNDSKLVIDILKTAQAYKTHILNYTKLESFIYENNKIIGLKLFDKLKNKEILIKCSCVFNATGHYVDKIRKLDNKSSLDITNFSKGSHILVSNKLLKIEEGLLIPKTKDGRVIFVLPWLDNCLIGTTDIQIEFEEFSKITKEEKEYLLLHINEYFNIEIKEEDILSSWSGIRTLLKEDNQSENVVREHIIEVSASNLISICGGKWTTARKIAEDSLDRAIKEDLLKIKKVCKTKNISLIGSFENKKKVENEIKKFNLKADINKHLINTYGKESLTLLNLYNHNNNLERIHKGFPYIKAEVLYCLKYEYIKKPMDYLARRIRLAFLDKNRCKSCIVIVADIIKEFYSLSSLEYEQLIYESQKELDEFF